MIWRDAAAVRRSAHALAPGELAVARQVGDQDLAGLRFHLNVHGAGARVVADGEAGFGGVLNSFEMMKSMMGPQLETMRKLAESGNIESEILVESITANPEAFGERVDVCVLEFQDPLAHPFEVLAEAPAAGHLGAGEGLLEGVLVGLGQRHPAVARGVGRATKPGQEVVR